MPFNNSISKNDWQYILIASLLISVFILTDLIGFVDKEFLYFVPRLISDQPLQDFYFNSSPCRFKSFIK